MQKEATSDAQMLHWMHTGRDVGSHPYPIPASDPFIDTNVEIKTDDGTLLRGDLYIPPGPPPFPAIFEATPYGAQGLARYGNLYATRGYLFLAIDCRGRYRSEGNWEPLTYDQADGHCIVRWLTKHKLCNQKIGTRGHSYSGYNQLLTAIDAPPELKALAVGVAPGDPFLNAPFQGGCYDLNDLFWLFDMSGRVDNGSRLSDKTPDEEDEEDEEDELEDDDDEDSPEEQEQDALLNAALMSRPFGSLDVRLGIFHTTFREWIKHWCFDDYWHKRAIMPRVAQIKAAALHISGWWDGNGRGATLFYRALRQNAGSEFARQNQKLLMGAYDHDLNAPDCDDLPAPEVEKIERAARRDCLNDEMSWFDQQLKGIRPFHSAQNRVTLFITGVNRWTYQDDWPLPQAEEETWYIDNHAKPRRLVSILPQRNKSAVYSYDPCDPTPFGDEDADAERMPFDNSGIQKERKDLLLFDSAEFNTPTAFVGEVQATVYAESPDLADFDIAVSLYDLYPDGRSIFLTDGIRRARFLRDYTDAKLLPKGTIGCFEVDLWHMGHVFRPGHRLRLQIASASYLRFDVNPGTGGDLADETNCHKGEIRIHTGKDFPSALMISRVAWDALFPDDGRAPPRNS